MRIVICGAGEVGSHAAEVLDRAGHSITIIDNCAERLGAIEESLDIRTVLGNCTRAETLTEAGVPNADMVVAATSHDEVNLLSATLAKRLGAAKVIARVHSYDFADPEAFDYAGCLGIDELICPEYSTAMVIAQNIRNPAAHAVETFARGQVEMQQFKVGEHSESTKKPLADLGVPKGARLAAVLRDGAAIIPDSHLTVEVGDHVVLVANADVFDAARAVFKDDTHRRRSVVILGGTPMAEWLCRSLRGKPFSIRLFEKDRERAEALAVDLDWVTVLNADPTDSNVFNEERVAEADDFVALLKEDETNIIGGVLAKLRGVETVFVVVQRSTYLEPVYTIGIDRAYSPRTVAAKQIENALDTSPVRVLSSLSDGEVSVFRVRVGEESSVAGKRLREVNLTPDWSVLAVQRGDATSVPHADDEICKGDVVLVLGRTDGKADLKKIFDAG